MSKCITEYIDNGLPCPCHPAESALIIEKMQEIVHAAAVKSIKELARQFVDDELVLSEEFIDGGHKP